MIEKLKQIGIVAAIVIMVTYWVIKKKKQICLNSILDKTMKICGIRIKRQSC